MSNTAFLEFSTSLLKFYVGGAAQDDIFLIRKSLPPGPIFFIRDTDTPGMLDNDLGQGSELMALPVRQFLPFILQKFENLQWTFRASFDNATQVEQKIVEIHQSSSFRRNDEVHENLGREVVKIMFRFAKKLGKLSQINYRQNEAGAEAEDEERNRRVQETFERKEKEMKEEEDTLSQEKEKTSSLSKELAVLKKERSNFYATRTRKENSMHEWMLVKELNAKLDKENGKVSDLEDALKLLKEDVLAKNVTVSNLEGAVEVLKNDSLQYQKTISALESELEEEKKKSAKTWRRI